MIKTQEVQGQWNQIKGKVKERWGHLTDDDLRIADGNLDQLIGRIQQRTGEARSTIESFLNDLAEHAGEPLQKVQAYAENAAEKAREGYDYVRDQAQQGYGRVERAVYDHPGSSMAAVFGLGLITGCVVGMILCTGRD